MKDNITIQSDNQTTSNYKRENTKEAIAGSSTQGSYNCHSNALIYVSYTDYKEAISCISLISVNSLYQSRPIISYSIL